MSVMPNFRINILPEVVPVEVMMPLLRPKWIVCGFSRGGMKRTRSLRRPKNLICSLLRGGYPSQSVDQRWSCGDGCKWWGARSW